MTDPVSSGFIAERDIILQVLEQVCPLETELVRPTTLDDILAGAEFAPVQGGSHFDLSLPISLVSCICSLTQLAIKAWELQHARKDPAMVRSGPDAREQRVQVAISEHLAHHPEVAHTLLDHGKTPQQVTRTIELVLTSSSAGSDRDRRANPD
jgi:hypothetical protein